jgi:hypothetical protein
MYFVLEGKFTAPTRTSFAYPTPEEAAYFAAKKTRPSYGCAQHVKFLWHTAAKKSRERKISDWRTYMLFKRVGNVLRIGHTMALANPLQEWLV